jgi:hypothetical protein
MQPKQLLRYASAMRLSLCALPIIAAIVLATSLYRAASAQPSVSVPFVGCRSDGQQGPQDAPRGSAKRLDTEAAPAQALAYYKMQGGPGVLGPRGWFCFGTYGSSGSRIYVSQQQIPDKLLFSTTWKGFNGPIIKLSDTFGGTSGRFGVAATIARVFPLYKSFVTKVQDEGFDPSTTRFPSGTYPSDLLHYLSNHVVEYTTPPNTEGLGTDSNLLKGVLPIVGVEILTGSDTDLISLCARLPAKSADLAQAITHQVEREYTDPPPHTF